MYELPLKGMRCLFPSASLSLLLLLLVSVSKKKKNLETVFNYESHEVRIGGRACAERKEKKGRK